MRKRSHYQIASINILINEVKINESPKKIWMSQYCCGKISYEDVKSVAKSKAGTNKKTGPSRQARCYTLGIKWRCQNIHRGCKNFEFLIQRYGFSRSSTKDFERARVESCQKEEEEAKAYTGSSKSSLKLGISPFGIDYRWLEKGYSVGWHQKATEQIVTASSIPN